MWIAAAAGRGFKDPAVQGLQVGGIQQVHAVVGIAFHRKNAALWREELLKNGHLKHAPEKIAFQVGQFSVADAREHDDGSLDRWERDDAGFDGLSQFTQH